MARIYVSVSVLGWSERAWRIGHNWYVFLSTPCGGLFSGATVGDIEMRGYRSVKTGAKAPACEGVGHNFHNFVFRSFQVFFMKISDNLRLSELSKMNRTC